MTINELYQRIEEITGRLARRLQEPLLALTEEERDIQTRYLVASQDAITNVRGWYSAQETINTLADVRTYQVPRGRVVQVTRSNLVLNEHRVIDLPVEEDQGAPTSYAVLRDLMMLSPVPDGAYELTLQIRTTDLFYEDEEAAHGWEVQDWLAPGVYKAMQYHALASWFADNAHEVASTFHERFAAAVRDLRPIEQKSKRTKRPYTPF